MKLKQQDKLLIMAWLQISYWTLSPDLAIFAQISRLEGVWWRAVTAIPHHEVK